MKAQTQDKGWYFSAASSEQGAVISKYWLYKLLVSLCTDPLFSLSLSQMLEIHWRSCCLPFIVSLACFSIREDGKFTSVRVLTHVSL